MSILFFISLVVFIVYVGIVLCKFKIPQSLSESSYLLGKNGRIWFYAALTLMAFPLMIFWLDITDGQTYQFLVFLCTASLCFTGVTGRFKLKHERPIHLISAYLASACSQIWALLTFKLEWAILMVFICLFCLMFAYNFKGASVDENGNIVRKNRSTIFFFEMGCFILTYIAILEYWILM